MKQEISEKIYKIICEVISQFNTELDNKIEIALGRDTRLFGGDSTLDSLELVSLIVNVEEAIEDEFGFSISLANDRAMSRRVSPFASVGILTDYIVELISEQR
jgi:acyl carrier protein